VPRFKGYIFDLDGTVYLSERLIPRADEVVAGLRRQGGRVAFLSNKAIQTRETYAAKLNRLGIPVRTDDVINSSLVTARCLAQEAPSARIYVVGERSLVEELQRAGLRPAADPLRTDFVILSFDRTFHYGKLHFAYIAVMHGARIWATNADRTCPFEEGQVPDAASVIGAVEACTGAKVERVLGKPSPDIMRVAAEQMGVPLAECIMVGDRLETDMVMGRAAGAATALVLTGVTTHEALAASDVRPDFVLDSVADMLEW